MTLLRKRIIQQRQQIMLQLRKEDGFSLIEVMAAIVILSVIIMMGLTYFSSSLSYTKTNENKTVMVNLARNALVYAEKQDFAAWKKYFITDSKGAITGTACTSSSACSQYSFLVTNSSPEVLARVLNPNVNGVQYTVTIRYQPTSTTTTSTSTTATDIRNNTSYLLPIQVSVQPTGRTNVTGTNVEGYITNETIR